MFFIIILPVKLNTIVEVIFSQVFIQNCKFGVLKRKSFNIHATDFYFTHNEVDRTIKSVFRITSKNVTFSRNTFSHIDNFAFLFVNIGKNFFYCFFSQNIL